MMVISPIGDATALRIVFFWVSTSVSSQPGQEWHTFKLYKILMISMTNYVIIHNHKYSHSKIFNNSYWNYYAPYFLWALCHINVVKMQAGGMDNRYYTHYNSSRNINVPFHLWALSVTLPVERVPELGPKTNLVQNSNNKNKGKAHIVRMYGRRVHIINVTFCDLDLSNRSLK